MATVIKEDTVAQFSGAALAATRIGALQAQMKQLKVDNQARKDRLALDTKEFMSRDARRKVENDASAATQAFERAKVDEIVQRNKGDVQASALELIHGGVDATDDTPTLKESMDRVIGLKPLLESLGAPTDDVNMQAWAIADHGRHTQVLSEIRLEQEKTKAFRDHNARLDALKGLGAGTPVDMARVGSLEDALTRARKGLSGANSLLSIAKADGDEAGINLAQAMKDQKQSEVDQWDKELGDLLRIMSLKASAGIDENLTRQEIRAQRQANRSNVVIPVDPGTGLPRPVTQEQYDALPSRTEDEEGSRFIDPNGEERHKD